MTEAFNGTWKIDLANSAVWDDQRRRHVPDEVGAEIIRLRIGEGIQDYEVLYGDRPVIRMGYTARYDDAEWVPYTVREIGTAHEENVEDSVASFKHRIKANLGSRERNFEVGQAYGLVRLISVDDRTHYRVSKDPRTGSAQSVMLRRLAEDGESYTATVLDVDGVVHRIRHFVRAGVDDSQAD